MNLTDLEAEVNRISKKRTSQRVPEIEKKEKRIKAVAEEEEQDVDDNEHKNDTSNSWQELQTQVAKVTPPTTSTQSTTLTTLTSTVGEVLSSELGSFNCKTSRVALFKSILDGNMKKPKKKPKLFSD
jgi:hypothetical protein